MPYPGIPDSKTKDMESCVSQLMSQGKSKSSAIAICHKSIMGSKVTSSETMKGGVEKMEEKKVEEKIKEEMKKEETPTEPKVEETPKAPAAPAAPAEEKPAEPKVEEKPAEPAAPAAPAEEVVEKKDAKENPKHGEEGHKCDEKCSEYGKEEKKKIADTKEEVTPKEVVVKVNLDELKAEIAKFTDAVKGVDEKLTKVEEKISKLASSDAASTEKKDTPKEVAKSEVAPKEEKAEKVDDASKGANEQVLKALADFKRDFEERIKKLEEQPAPSKVVFSKEFGGQKDEETLTAEKINARLEELKKVMSVDPERYLREEMADEAIALVKQKKALKASKK